MGRAKPSKLLKGGAQFVAALLASLIAYEAGLVAIAWKRNRYG